MLFPISLRGVPFGKVVIEDFEGPGELALFGDAWAQFKGYFCVGASLFITGMVQARTWGEPLPQLNITKVDFLADIKSSKIKRLNIICNIDVLDEERVSELVAMLADSPGDCELDFTLCDPIQNTKLTMTSNGLRINISKKIIDYIESNDALTYKIN